MLKHLMVGRDAWIFKKSDLGDHKNMKKKTMTLQDIESKLKRLEYSKVDEFVDDMMSVFSYPRVILQEVRYTKLQQELLKLLSSLGKP
ncbi:hypothetical protein ACSQ67_025128 [Phaseolus vulgaris]